MRDSLLDWQITDQLENEMKSGPDENSICQERAEEVGIDIRYAVVDSVGDIGEKQDQKEPQNLPVTVKQPPHPQERQGQKIKGELTEEKPDEIPKIRAQLLC